MPLQRLSILLAALWWGGITALSFLAVPLLFASLGSPAAAGPVAARIFSLQCWAGLVLGLALLLLLRRWRGESAAVAPEALTIMGFVLLAMLLALMQEFGVAQNIVTARATGGNLRLWHGVGTAMVLGQWLCAGAVLWRLAGARSAQG
jgi:hypothetical protein